MVINFSRHARRRAKLYNIPNLAVEKILTELDLGKGKHEIITDISGFQYPIKLVVDVEDGIITVITNYPLKKGKADESTL